jgi:hypothetical protein
LADPVFDVLKKHGVGLVFSHWPWRPPLRKPFAKVKGEWDGLRESDAKAFPFHKMIPGMLDSEMIEDTARIINEAIKNKVQANLIINNHAGGNAPLIAQKIADRLHSEKQRRLF